MGIKSVLQYWIMPKTHTPTGLDRAIAFFGSIEQLASALGITRQAVYMWDGVIPKLRAFEIEVESGGKLTRQQLRPDIYR